MTLGERIAQERRELAVLLRRDITPADLAEMLGVNPATVYRWEADEKAPRDAALAALAALFKRSLAYLRYGVVNADGTPEVVERPKTETPTLEEIAAREGTTVSPRGQPMAEFLAGEAAKKKAPAKKIGGRKRAS